MVAWNPRVVAQRRDKDRHRLAIGQARGKGPLDGVAGVNQNRPASLRLGGSLAHHAGKLQDRGGAYAVPEEITVEVACLQNPHLHLLPAQW